MLAHRPQEELRHRPSVPTAHDEELGIGGVEQHAAALEGINPFQDGEARTESSGQSLARRWRRTIMGWP